jgi:hypothetical protein
MTIVISCPSSDFIIMLSDSAITNEHLQEDGTVHEDYETGSKTICYQGIGCITRWGDNIRFPLRSYLEQYRIPQTKPSVSDLKEFVRQYLDGYSKESPDGVLGFHVAGFENERPKLYHVFFAHNQPPQPEPKAVHAPDQSGENLLFNGRNDLAFMAIRTLQYEMSQRKTRFDIKTPLGRILMCDFIARFVAEITPQVGPPFEINIVFPDNTIDRIINPSLSPISLHVALPVLSKILGQSAHTSSVSQWGKISSSSQLDLASQQKDNSVQISSAGTVALLPDKTD